MYSTAAVVVLLATVAFAAPIDPMKKQEKTAVKVNDDPMPIVSTTAIWISSSSEMPKIEEKAKKAMHDEAWTSTTMMMPKDEPAKAEMFTTHLMDDKLTTAKVAELNEPLASTVAIVDDKWTPTTTEHYWPSSTTSAIDSDEHSSDDSDEVVIGKKMADPVKKLPKTTLASKMPPIAVTTMLPKP